jgi:hypothetical protein
MRIRKRSRLLFLVMPCSLLVPANRALAQDTVPDPYRDIFTSERWCADSGTACWRSPRESSWFNGIRFIAEFDLRFVFQPGRNRFDAAGLQALPKLAVEVNIYKSWAALQLAVTGPGTVTLDSASASRARLARDQHGSVRTDIGYTLAFSFLDSSIATGFGRLNYDLRGAIPSCSREAEALNHERERWRNARLDSLRQQVHGENRLQELNVLAQSAEAADSARQSEQAARVCLLRTERSDSFWFIALQPVSTLRSNLKKPLDEREQ